MLKKINTTYSTPEEIRDGITIVTPTFNRHDNLKIALLSAFKQNIVDRYVEIIVIDNNKTPQEETQVNILKRSSPYKITYVHIAEAGLSNARNAAMDLIRTRYVAFLDDDMIASPDWLTELIKTSIKYDAGIVFAPAFARMPDQNDPLNPYMEPYFSRLIDDNKEGIIHETLGMGGCLLDLNYCDLPTPPFDNKLNKTGGEDDILFDYLRQRGVKIAWSPAAITHEIVSKDRATARYIQARNFGYGQGPTRICASRGRLGIGGVLYYMSSGFIQTLLYGPTYLVLKLLKKPSYIKYLALTSRALGKIFWLKKFSLNLYGKT